MRNILLTGLIVVLVFACGKNEDKKIEINKTGIEIKNAWISPSGKGMNTGAFFTIINNSEKDDTLISAKFEFADVVQIHESFKSEDGRFGMNHLEFLVIPKGEEVVFKPRSYHVMLIRLTKDLGFGEKYNLILEFKNAGLISFPAEVR